MAERSNKKIPVTEREFLWVQDDDKGEVVLHVGPTMVSPTAADRVVFDDGESGFKEDPYNRPQKMLVVGDDQYCVLYNPLLEKDESAPNGKFRQGRNEARKLKNGTRAMIPGPCSFYLWPGQRAEVRDAHELGSNQYLVVKVYGECDDKAPFYDITAKSAGIKTAIAADVGKEEESDDSPLLKSTDTVTLTRGQLIVIRGIDTQLYIPPTGVDIVPDTSFDIAGNKLSAITAEQLLQDMRRHSGGEQEEQTALELQLLEIAMEPESSKGQANQQAAPRRKTKTPAIDQNARTRQRVQQQHIDLPQQQMQAPEPEPQEESQQRLMEMLGRSSLLRSAYERTARKAHLVRNAVVLGEKEYCIILDADGKRQVKVGPARVFPGPYDIFMVEGSRERIYDAYEMLPHRALWLRVISKISRTELAKILPDGFKLDKEEYKPGDELLMHGVSSFFFPFNEIEILSPQTGLAAIGNDHDNVFIESIGIDQKSGIYVRDMDTGEARLVRGKQSYLIDPRKEVHITRSIPTDDWNLWIALNEPHKRTSQPVTTPWAVSISIPHNHAVLVTSSNGQRVIEGPCVELLGYEEKLVCLDLSSGRPKTDERTIKTCFLRTTGNRISDIIQIETKDFVKIDIEVSYSVTFLPEARERWFTHENYVQVLVDHMRSLVRSRSRSLSLMELWPQIPHLLRDTILGPKPTDGPRAGRTFTENGMRVSEVEVLFSTILDPQIAELMHTVQSQSVALQIGDREEQEKLKSSQLRDDYQRQQHELLHAQKTRELKAKETIQQIQHQLSVLSIQQREELSQLQEELAANRQLLNIKSKSQQNALSQESSLQLQTKEAEVKSHTNALLHKEEIEHKTSLRQLEIKLLEAHALAISQQHQSVQPALIEAMTALGDKIMLSEVAQNMNLISLFQGKDVGNILSEVLGGTKVIPTLQELLKQYPSPKTENKSTK